MWNMERVMSASPVIPVIVIDDLDDAVPIAEALLDGGLHVLEITLRTEFGLAAISIINQTFPEAIIAAGTVTTPEEVVNAQAAGAEFLVSPGCTPRLLDAAIAANLPLLPGINTSSEAMLLRERGVKYMKFFPAEAAGGVAMLKSMAGPLPELRFCPTGGVNLDNAAEYLDLPNVLCVGGSWMLDKTAIREKDWGAVAALARQAAKLGKR